MFFKLLDEVQGRTNEEVISVLLDTFTNADDYGVQERVLIVLDGSDPIEFASELSKGFERLLARSSEKEWPLILLGRVFNTGGSNWIVPITDAARSNPVLRDFLRSDDFLAGYPEVKAILNKAGV
ncbi:hypothetical protein [Pseudomonas sp. SWI6]|uniref:hypothetical protein n=1 Tax=Pseudomonas sp. SWI6 TaxID=2083051 RepID=UPI00131A0AC2|nr:hypothetical protein [Pseudomonas sp. SWI6]